MNRMFKHILIPISSEHYSDDVLKRGVFLAEKCQSKIHLLYIIEEKTLVQAEKKSDIYRTVYNRADTKQEAIREQMHTADQIVFDKARRFFKQKKIASEGIIVEGEFSEMIHREVTSKKYDLILMGFEKACMLNYRVLDELELDVDIPIWVVSTIEGSDQILAVCSNLAPNKKVPDFSIALARQLNWGLHMLYVIDMEDSVQVDAQLDRSAKKSEGELMETAKQFVGSMAEKGIRVTLVRGNLQKEIFAAGERLDAKLIIVGREQKKKTVLGLPAKRLKKKMAEKCRYSILFVR